MRPMRSWPKRAWVGMPNTVDISGAGAGRTAGALPLPARRSLLLLHQRTLALIERAEGLVGGNGRADLVVVPRRLRLRGLLHLHEIGGSGLSSPPPHPPPPP